MQVIYCFILGIMGFLFAALVFLGGFFMGTNYPGEKIAELRQSDEKDKEKPELDPGLEKSNRQFAKRLNAIAAYDGMPKRSE